MRFVVLILLGGCLLGHPVLLWSDGAAPAEAEIAQHLALGKSLAQCGEYEAAQAEFRAVLQLDATQPDALRWMTKTQQAIEEAQAKAQRMRARLRQRAQDLAVKFAREKSKQLAAQEAQARAQVSRAREQQLKLLYTRGLTLYRQGDYQAAIETLQQMALLDPTHPLIREAQRLITRAETKQAEVRAHASIRGAPTAVPELEQQLAAKRMEIETALKYARMAVKARNYDMATELLQRILAQDPHHRQAQQMLDGVQMAKLKAQEDRLEQHVKQDEQAMMNAVVQAQVLPEPKPAQLVSPPAALTFQQAMAAKLQQPISLDFTDVALSDVLQFVADAATISIIPSPHLDLQKQRVTIKMNQLPLEQALKFLVKSQSLAYRVESDAILIATEEEFANEPVETRLFFLRNGLGPFTLETAAVTPNPALAMESIKELVEKTVPQPPDSRLIVDERTGALIATNTPENLSLIEQLLSQLDITPVQVLIEARFVELTMTDLEELSLEGVLTGDYPLSKENAAGGGVGPGNILAKGGGSKFPDFKLSGASREDEGGMLTVEGVLTSLQFEAALHALEETKKSKTLSAPRVTALNNQTAQIRVVEEFNYPTRYEVRLIQFDINGDGDFDDAGETEFANVPLDIQKRDVGILLNVTPSIGEDGKTITLVLAPEVSSAGDFRDLGGGVTVPSFTSSKLTTSVVIENGQTVVLGGLMKDEASTQTMKVPVLGDLPLVGGLFRQTSDYTKRKNLLIFITARILAPRGQTA